MTITLPDLPYAKNALAPHISEETIEFHYGKHHNAYVTKLNGMIEGTDFAGKSLEEIVKSSSGGMFNNAAQVWNHTFYWHGLSPQGGGDPTGSLKACIEQCFGSVAEFKKAFNEQAAANFGSGWTWLVKKADSKQLEIVNTNDADTPIVDDSLVPLFTVDVWEHAYYIDYRNERPKYLEKIWELVNWEFVQHNFDHPESAASQFQHAA